MEKLAKYRELAKMARVELAKDFTTMKATATGKPFNGYLGWTGYGNLGDEAVYEAFDALFPSEHFVPFRIVSKPAQTFQRLVHQPVPIKNMALGGGTLINQSRIWLEHVEYAVANDIPVFCIGSGVASSSFWKAHPGVHSGSDLERWAAALQKFVFVGVRGPRSQAALKEAGVEAEIVGDTAIALAPEKFTPKKSFKKVIGINVSFGTDNVMYGDAETFLKEMAGAVQKLCKQGYTVRILPIWAGDMPASKALEAAVHHSGCTIVRAYANTPEYLAAIDDCDLFIGQKLHATIFSTMLRKPSLMLEYRPKCLDYMESIDMAKFSLRTDAVSVENVVAAVGELADGRDAISKTLDERIGTFRALQRKRAAEIKKSLR